MPYFFILPPFAVLLVGLVGAAVITRFVPRVRPASGYIVGSTAGVFIGFITMNVVVLAAGIAPAWLAHKLTFSNWLQQALKYFVAAALLIGSFIGSAVGVLLGAASGFFLVYRRRRNAASVPG